MNIKRKESSERKQNLENKISGKLYQFNEMTLKFLTMEYIYFFLLKKNGNIRNLSYLQLIT